MRETYLLDPQLPWLSVKIRGGGALEVKAYRGSPGILEVAGRARGRMESWQKWSFPFSPLSPGTGDPPGWTPVRKRRRISRFPLASGHIVARGPGLGQEPQCEVELTEVHTSGQDWWTLGFETTGPTHLLRSELEATAALGFAQALPGGVEPGPDQSRSYAQWLGQWPGTDRDADALDGRPSAEPAGLTFSGGRPNENLRGGITTADHIEAVRLARKWSRPCPAPPGSTDRPFYGHCQAGGDMNTFR